MTLNSYIIFNIFFFFFSGLVIVSSFLVVFSKNPVYSVLFLILVFLNSAFVILLLDLEFFAILLIIIYIGAVMVLFTLCGFLVFNKISFRIRGIDREAFGVFRNLIVSIFISKNFCRFKWINLVDSLAGKGGDIWILRKFSIDKSRSIFWKWKSRSNTIELKQQPSPQLFYSCFFYFEVNA